MGLRKGWMPMMSMGSLKSTKTMSKFGCQQDGTSLGISGDGARLGRQQASSAIEMACGG